jgi:hypothetical protein
VGYQNGTPAVSNYTFTTAGTYSVFVYGQGDNTGSVNVNLLSFTNLTGTISFNTTTTMGTTIAGQTDTLTFTATAGQTVTLDYDNGSSDTYPNYGARIGLEDSNGNQLTNNWVGYQNGTPAVSNYTFTTAGTYSVFVYGQGDNTGSVNMYLKSP